MVKEDGNMVKVALFVRLEAKTGKEADVEKFLRGGLEIVQEEPATTTWYGIKLGPSTFGIFDTFPTVLDDNESLAITAWCCPNCGSEMEEIQALSGHENRQPRRIRYAIKPHARGADGDAAEDWFQVEQELQARQPEL